MTMVEIYKEGFAVFTPSKELLEDIENRNVRHIRNEFYTIAHEDRAFVTGKFEEALAFVKNKELEGLFVPFDQEPFKNEDEWSRDYWAELVASLMDNFCMERILHLKEVGKVVYAHKVRPVVSPARTQQRTVVYGETRGKKTVPIALIVVVAIACLAAVIAIGLK